MDQAQHNAIVGFIWGVADDVLRDLYVRGKYEVQDGEIIYTKIRPYLRKATIAPFSCLCSADMYPISIHLDEQLDCEFLLLAMLSLPFTQYTVDCSLRAAMPKVNRETLGEAPVWFPGLVEQTAIVEYLNQATADIDTVIIHANREIELLNEYRTRLIADVVTGKLDVHEAAAFLPEKPEDLEEKNDLLSKIDESEINVVTEFEEHT